MSTTPPPPPPPSNTPPPPDAPREDDAEATHRPWWKRWWVIVLGIVLLFAFCGSLIEDESDDEPAAEIATTEPAETETTEEPSEAKTTEEPSEVASTLEAEVSEEASDPPEEYTLSEEDMRTLAFPIVFDSSRDGVIGVLRDMRVIESVDQYVYDEETGTVMVSLTPAFDFDEGVRDDAWSVMRAFAELYTTDAWLDPEGTFTPALDVEISTAHYRCDGEMMVALAEARLSRNDWENTCRVS